ncbi:hypothetical protein KAI87_12670, partial [Myxococcota bacterium]|nr:hypothetical protein [Myxococcota bacterium]
MHKAIRKSALIFLFIIPTLYACSSDCPEGTHDCPCFDNGTCLTSDDDKQLVCSAGECVLPLCDIGSDGCACYPNLSCNDGMRCDANPEGPTCYIDESDLTGPPPLNPVCYTPCRSDLELGGGARRVCSPEGLMAG